MKCLCRKIPGSACALPRTGERSLHGRFLASLLALALFGCGDLPVVPLPPAPTPVPVPPDPIPVPPQPDEIAVARWDGVAVGMTEAEVVAVAGKSAHRTVVGPGFLALGYFIRVDGKSVYVEAVFGKDGKVSGKTRW